MSSDCPRRIILQRRARRQERKALMTKQKKQPICGWDVDNQLRNIVIESYVKPGIQYSAKNIQGILRNLLIAAGHYGMAESVGKMGADGRIRFGTNWIARFRVRHNIPSVIVPVSIPNEETQNKIPFIEDNMELEEEQEKKLFNHQLKKSRIK